LLREHLSRLQLPAPTLELRLHCADWVASAPPNESLFPTPRSESEGLVHLIERLQARLGPGQVRRLVAAADHRPECASRSLPAQAALGRAEAAIGRGALHGAPTAPRPVWLLNPPQALREHRHRPWLDGQPLQLLCGPERIETGWWDGLPAERDYFIARQGSGALVWVYRLRHARIPEGVAGEAAPGWFLQGRFG
jgi:protein ImuB